MKKTLTVLILMLVVAISSFGQSFIDRGYLNLDGPSSWSDAYVIYSLTTSNEKGGKAKTVFEEYSFNKVLDYFKYDSEDYPNLLNEYHLICEDLECFSTYNSDVLDDVDLLVEYMYDKDYTENEKAVQIIEEKCELYKKQLIEDYIRQKENFQKLSAEEKAILQIDFYKPNVTSNILVKYSRYVDSRDGFFTFKIYQKETNDTIYFRVYDYTEVYFDEVNNNHLRTYNNLDKKVLAICSELSINNEIVFGVLKENSLKPYKDCGFILIRSKDTSGK